MNHTIPQKQRGPYGPPPMSAFNASLPGNYVGDFIQAMRQAGLQVNENIIGDGKIHRFSPGNRGPKDAWYVFHGLAGAFGDWRRGIHEVWSLKRNGSAPPNLEELHAQIESARKQAEEERNRKQEEISLEAITKWDSLSKTGTSPYLERKQVAGFGVRFEGETVVVPVRDTAGKLWSLQTIHPDGTKRFLAGGRKKGCFHLIGTPQPGGQMYVVEGYATGASVHRVTGAPVAIAFDAGNLEPVVEALVRAYSSTSIILAGDDDKWKENNVGRKTAEEVAQKYGCSVVFPSFKNIETQPTDFNDLHVLEGIEEVKKQLTLFDAWPEPTPLSMIKVSLPPVLPFPPALIPGPYQAWLCDIAERMQCPLDYVAVGSLIVTASLIGSGCSIRPKSMDSWSVVPNLWGGIIGNPSTLKSPALKEILKPLEILENRAFEIYEQDQRRYLGENEAHKALQDVIKKEMSKAAHEANPLAMDIAKEKLRNLKEPTLPQCKRYSTNDATIEKMHELLSKNERGLLLFRDELMGLLTQWDKQGHESDRAFYLEAWNGYGSKTTDRIGRGTIHTKNLCISLLGSTQPSKLLSYFQHAFSGTNNDGLLQRFQLLVYPDEPKTWTLIDRRPNESAREHASSLMIKLSQMDFCVYGAQRDEKSGIPYFHFDSQGQSIFYEWLAELENKLRSPKDEPLILEHLAKYRKLMPSLALIFHLINLASGTPPGPVTSECVERAAGWCDYLESHARRIYQLSSSSSHQAARTLARRIQRGELGKSFDSRDVYRKEWTFLKTREEVELACSLLMDNGWLKEGILPGGRKAKRGYFINPTIEKGFSHE